ncbi:MAG: hypothetical protein MJ096_06130 [Clostridia bacterium]|nr:hypothetical protein [Clostridia bacterium]
MNVQNLAVINGRKIEMFHHESGAEFGYSKPQTDSFGLMLPKDYDETKKYPLYLVLHSAGHELFSCLATVNIKGDHDIYDTPDDSFGLYPDCYRNMANEKHEWFWGGTAASNDDRDEACTTELQPVEKRVLATLEWVFENYPVDRERVYAVGNSMGGTGSLGIAVPRGDIFAAVKANVPAGVNHVLSRLGYEGDAPEGFKSPDLPVIVDYSSQTDQWSRGHERLYDQIKKHKYAIMGFWGPYGHENDNEKIARHIDIVHAFDIGSVKLHEAYPAFTDATTDDVLPWPETMNHSTESGQVNAFFRWKVIADTEDCFEIELRLLAQDEYESRLTFPKESTADVTIRRLQKFAFSEGDEVSFTFGDKSGKVKLADSLTIPGLTVTTAPKVLKISK